MKIAIVGLGSSYADFISARVNSQKFDEIWGINSIGGIIHVDRTIMMDPVSRFLDTKNAGTQTEIAREFLKNNKKPIYTCELDKRVKHLVKYPLAEVVKNTRLCYFNNTVPYAIALAIYEKVDKIYRERIPQLVNSDNTKCALMETLILRYLESLRGTFFVVSSSVFALLSRRKRRAPRHSRAATDGIL